MAELKREYIEKIYAGWLAKVIGIRLGAPIEGWSYEEIKRAYGQPQGYLVDYRDFAADDDSNGPLFFLRALEDSGKGAAMEAQDVALALLNYAPFEHGFFWWGGYGVSTEHTAYLNLRAGIPAPQSGSIAQNGAMVAEQIGGQIFIDTWGLVAPGNPDLAARLAKAAASVTHDGNGIWGGVFLAACISHAFEEPHIPTILEKGLSYLPESCEYTRVVRAVQAFYDHAPGDWHACYAYIHENFGYDKYPGNCHIIPNAAVMILALLYGEGDFSNTLNICNLCGWDTDCNVGNVATIMGVVCGLEGIGEGWRKPVNDFLACSSVVGSLNIMDIPYGACYIAKQAWALAGQELPAPWKDIAGRRIDSCHFEFPGSTHAMRARQVGGKGNQTLEVTMENTGEAALTGSRSLKITAKPLGGGERLLVYKKTYYTSADFHDSRYDPAFSPLLYPGQTVHAGVCLPQGAKACTARLYTRESRSGELLEGQPVVLEPGRWAELSLSIPPLEGALIDEAGVAFDCREGANAFVAYLDELHFAGVPAYTLDFACEREEAWNVFHKEISQMTRLKGLAYLEEGQLHLSCSDFAEAYTGRHDWEDYTLTCRLTPLTGQWHMVNFRVQGAMRSYGVGFGPGGVLGLYKNENGYRMLAQLPMDWRHGMEYELGVKAQGDCLTVYSQGKALFSYVDSENPYLTGSAGVSVREGSHCAYRLLQVGGIAPCRSEGV